MDRKVKEVIANVQVVLDEKNELILELEKRQKVLEDEIAKLKKQKEVVISEDVLGLFEPLLNVGNTDKNEKEDFVEQVVPALPRGLSASGTDFSGFLRKGGKTEIVPVPRSSVEREVSPTPKQYESPTLKSRKFHVNDFSALNLKQRRMERAQSAIVNLSMSEEVSIEEEEGEEKRIAVTKSENITQSRMSQKERRDRLKQSGAAKKAEMEDERGSNSSPPNHVSTRSLATSTKNSVSNHDSPTLPPKTKNSSRVQEPGIGKIPSADIVNEVLLERYSGSSSSHGSNSIHHTPSGSLKAATSSHMRKRSGSHLIGRLASSVFSAKEHSKKFESSGDIALTHDGGFTAHNICFGHRPIFNPPKVLDYEIESHNVTEPSREWGYNFSTLSVPSCLQNLFETVKDSYSKYWKWPEGKMIIAVFFGETSDIVNAIVISSEATQKFSFEFPNGHVMPSMELDQKLLPLINPIIRTERCYRIRGEDLTAVTTRLKEFEALAVPRVVDVCIVNGVVDELRKTPKTPPNPRKRTPLFTRFLNVLTREVDPVLDPGEMMSYKWNGIEVRLHCVPTLAQSVHSIAICLVGEESGIIKEIFSPTSGSNLVVIGARENQHKFEFGCCRHIDLTFGPLFFESPVKGKFVQSLVTAKILHAFCALPSFKERRYDAFEEKILNFFGQ